MRIFVAGATGTLGRPVVRLLRARGHDVVGLTRSSGRAAQLRILGADAVVGDALNAQSIVRAVVEARPDVVLHLLTALPAAGALRAAHLRSTNELRVTGTAHLIRAAREAGAGRLVAESFVGIYGSGAAAGVLTEDDPLPPVPDGAFAEAVRALRALEDQLRVASDTGSIETAALRIGLLYGRDVPSTAQLIRQARAGRLFVPRNLPGILPFVHIDDAAAAIVRAVEQRGAAGVFNVVDDEAMPLTRFLDALAHAVGAPPPRHMPAWLLRLAAPVMAQAGSARLVLSNARAKRELAWQLHYPTVRQGLVAMSGAAVEAA